MEQAAPKKRSMPRALYHVTTERHWRLIQEDGLLKPGKGYGWEERQGVFALGWNNWLLSLHYLPFLTLKLKGRNDRLVVLKIDMSPQLHTRTKVAFISSIETPVGSLLLEKARSGYFSTIKPDEVVLLPSIGNTLIRNTFALAEFVRAVPPSDDRIEYIIEDCDIPVSKITKVAEVARTDIPANILKAGRRLARKMKYRQATKNNKPVTRRPKPLVTQADHKAFISALLQSRHRLFRR